MNSYRIIQNIAMKAFQLLALRYRSAFCLYAARHAPRARRTPQPQGSTTREHAALHAACTTRTRIALPPDAAPPNSRHHARTTTHDDEKMLRARKGTKLETPVDGARGHWAVTPATGPRCARGSPPFSSHASVAQTATRSSTQGPASALRFNYKFCVSGAACCSVVTGVNAAPRGPKLLRGFRWFWLVFSSFHWFSLVFAGFRGLSLVFAGFRWFLAGFGGVSVGFSGLRLGSVGVGGFWHVFAPSCSSVMWTSGEIWIAPAAPVLPFPSAVARCSPRIPIAPWGDWKASAWQALCCLPISTVRLWPRDFGPLGQPHPQHSNGNSHMALSNRRSERITGGSALGCVRGRHPRLGLAVRCGDLAL